MLFGLDGLLDFEGGWLGEVVVFGRVGGGGGGFNFWKRRIGVSMLGF
jgi:hypothetical protein